MLSTTEALVPQDSVVFVIGPSLNHSQDRVEAFKRFVIEGGTLVIMDETGIANSLLSALGLDVHIDGHLVLDAVFYHRSWKMPKIINFESHSVTRGVESIILNRPSTLIVKNPNIKILARTSSFSFLDLNGDGQPQDDEPLGPFIVLADVKYGRGRVILVSDSSLFINGVLNYGDNIKLLKNIVEDKAVYVDTSIWQATTHSIYRDVILAIYGVLSSSELKYCMTALTVAVIYALTSKRGAVRRVDEVEEILRSHPDWDKQLLTTLKEERDKLES